MTTQIRMWVTIYMNNIKYQKLKGLLCNATTQPSNFLKK